MVQSTNFDDLTEVTSRQLTRAAEILGGKPWGAEQGKPRIYFDLGRRDAKAFMDFPDWPTGDWSELLGGARVVVQVADCGQAPAWYASQKAKLGRRLWRHSLALSALSAGDEQLARGIMAELGDGLEAELVDLVAGHLVNGRLAEARAALEVER